MTRTRLLLAEAERLLAAYAAEEEEYINVIELAEMRVIFVDDSKFQDEDY